MMISRLQIRSRGVNGGDDYKALPPRDARRFWFDEGGVSFASPTFTP